jgi:hypothetical protein
MDDIHHTYYVWNFDDINEIIPMNQINYIDFSMHVYEFNLIQFFSMWCIPWIYIFIPCDLICSCHKCHRCYWETQILGLDWYVKKLIPNQCWLRTHIDDISLITTKCFNQCCVGMLFSICLWARIYTLKILFIHQVYVY